MARVLSQVSPGPSCIRKRIERSRNPGPQKRTRDDVTSQFGSPVDYVIIFLIVTFYLYATPFNIILDPSPISP